MSDFKAVNEYSGRLRNDISKAVRDFEETLEEAGVVVQEINIDRPRRLGPNRHGLAVISVVVRIDQ